MSYGNKPNEIRHPQAALLAEEYVCQRVQSLGYTADLNSEEVYQLTDVNVVEVVDADPTVSLTIDSNEFGSINLYNQLAGFKAFPTNPNAADLDFGFTEATLDNTNHRDGTISHTDFGTVATDFIVPIKEATEGLTTRSLWFSNCFIDSISGTYQVDGFASESISMSGASQSWFLNEYAGARVGIAPFIGVGGVDHSVADLGADASVVYLVEDGIPMDTQYWALAAQQFITQGGYSFKSGSDYRYIEIPATATFPTIPQDTGTLIGGVKEGEIELVMWDNGYDSEPGVGVDGDVDFKTLRVQSVDFEIAFDREDLKQLYTGTYYKGLNTITVTATITALDSDLEMWALTSGQISDYTTDALTEISLSDFQSMGDVGARIDVFNTKNSLLHSGTTLLKSITLLGGKVTSVSDSRDVPGRGSQTFELQFTSLHFTGTGLVGR